FQAEAGIRDFHVTGVQTCALPISTSSAPRQTACRWRWCAEPGGTWSRRTAPAPPPCTAPAARTSSAEARRRGPADALGKARGCRSEERRVGKERRRRLLSRRLTHG